MKTTYYVPSKTDMPTQWMWVSAYQSMGLEWRTDTVKSQPTNGGY